jgi:hypothetical protein
MTRRLLFSRARPTRRFLVRRISQSGRLLQPDPVEVSYTGTVGLTEAEMVTEAAIAARF